MSTIVSVGRLSIELDKKSTDQVAKDVTKAGKEAGIGFSQSMEKSFDKVGKKLKALSSKMGQAIKFGAVAAAAGIGGLGVAAFKAGEALSTSNARTLQIAESMSLFGGQTTTVVDRLNKLAEATARETGMNNNSIKAAQAKLMTFSELAKSADSVGAAFDRTTKVAVDMEAAGFGSAEQSAVMLGKALQDPVAGLSALNRVGVSFTEEQKETIKTMVAAGKSAEAQGVILKALETQVGGTAKATANSSDIIKESFNQVLAKVGEKLLPVFATLATNVSEKWMPAVMGAVERFSPVVSRVFSRVSGFVKELLPSFKRFAAALVPVFATVFSVIAGLGKALFNTISFVKNNQSWVVPLAAGVATLVGSFAAYVLVTKAVAGAKTLAATATKAFTLATQASKLALLGHPLFIIGAVLVSLGVAFYVAYKKSETFRNAINLVGEKIKEFGARVWGVIKQIGVFFQGLWVTIQPVVQKVVHVFVGVLKPALQLVFIALKTYFTAWISAMKLVWNNVLKPMIQGLVKLWVSYVQPALARVWTGLKLAFSLFVSGIVAFWNSKGKPFIQALIFVWKEVLWPALRFVFDGIKKNWLFVIQALSFAWNNLGKPLVNGFISGWERAGRGFRSFGDVVGSVWGSIKSKTSSGVNGLIRFINKNLIGNFNKLASFFGTKQISQLGLFGFGGGNSGRGGRGSGPSFGGVRAFQNGGSLDGGSLSSRGWLRAKKPGTDTIAAWAGNEPVKLDGGEFVVNKKSAAKNRNLLEAINSGKIKAFASGGWLSQTKERLGSFFSTADNPWRTFTNQVMSGIKSISNSGFGQVLRAIPKTIMSAMKAKFSDTFRAGDLGGAGYDLSVLPGNIQARVRAAQSYVRRMNGLPYRLAGSPNASGTSPTDCSGLVSAVHRILLGRSPSGRWYSTHTMKPGNYGFASGAGKIFTAGVNYNKPGRAYGHTAGQVGGLGFESAGGGKGHVIGSRAKSPYRFSRQLHVPAIEAMAREKRMTGVFDMGGLANGRGIMFKNTIEPERVLSPRQTTAFETLVDATEYALSRDANNGSNRGEGDTIIINVYETEDAESTASEVMRRIKARR